MNAVIANATFSGATCADSSTSLVVTIDFEISMPLAHIQTAECADTNNGAVDPYGTGCDYYVSFPSDCGADDDDDFSSNEMCCACGGGAAADSVLAHVTTVLETAVSDGSLTTAIQSFATRRRRLDADDKRVEPAFGAARRRLDMTSAQADSVSVGTFSPSAAPSPTPSAAPTPSPTSPPTSGPTTSPVPTPQPTPVPTASLLPTAPPTSNPSPAPSIQPSPAPSSLPTITSVPTLGCDGKLKTTNGKRGEYGASAFLSVNPDREF